MGNETNTCGECKHYVAQAASSGEYKAPIPDIARVTIGRILVAASRPACAECFARKGEL